MKSVEDLKPEDTCYLKNNNGTFKFVGKMENTNEVIVVPIYYYDAEDVEIEGGFIITTLSLISLSPPIQRINAEIEGLIKNKQHLSQEISIMQNQLNSLTKQYQRTKAEIKKLTDKFNN